MEHPQKVVDLGMPVGLWPAYSMWSDIPLVPLNVRCPNHKLMAATIERATTNGSQVLIEATIPIYGKYKIISAYVEDYEVKGDARMDNMTSIKARVITPIPEEEETVDEHTAVGLCLYINTSENISTVEHTAVGLILTFEKPLNVTVHAIPTTIWDGIIINENVDAEVTRQ